MARLAAMVAAPRVAATRAMMVLHQKAAASEVNKLTYRIFSTLGLPRIYNGQFICDSEILCAFVAGINIFIYHLARCSTRKSSNCK
jgi:hypothetical protein